MDQNFHQIYSHQGFTSNHSLLASQTMPIQQQQERRSRNGPPEDMDGALRYTPLTSVLPATGVLQVIPSPQFSHSFPTELPINPESDAQLQQYFDLMNRNASNPQERNFQLEEFRNTINLVNQVDDRNILFKTPPRLTTQPTSTNATLQTPPQLGGFEQGVLDRVTSNFRYPTPMTPEHPIEQLPQQVPPKDNFSVVIPTQPINRQNAIPPQLLQSQEPPRRQTFAVEIPARTIHHSTHPTPIASPIHKRQKLPPMSVGRQASLSPTPQRAIIEKDRVEALVNQFATLLEDIFEAEDAFNPDANSPTEGSLNFFASESLHEEKPWLSREMHRKLDAHLRRLSKTSAGRDGLRIDSADLARITAICERCVKAAEEVDLKGLEEEDDAEREWVVKKLGKVENAILAANVIMLLIAGRGTDQQIYSEETLKTIVEVLRMFIDSLFHWISAGATDAASSDTLSVAMACSKQISALLQSCIGLMSQFELQLAETVSQESIINVLQFLSIEAIFLENQGKDKEAIISNQEIENLRVISMGILRQVFASYPEQRNFILDEVLTSLAKLPANRQQARHFKLLDGKSIQLVSALMMRLVQACGACFNSRMIDNVAHEAMLMGNDEDIDSVRQKKRVELCAEEWKSAANAAQHSATYIVTYLTSRALQTTKNTPSDSPFKALLDIFTEDFLTVLTAPEWPAGELLLRCLVKNLYACIDSSEHGAQVKNVALDAVGQIAAKIRTVQKKLFALLNAPIGEETHMISLVNKTLTFANGPSLTFKELEDLQELHRLIWTKADWGMRDALRFQVCQWANFILSTDRIDEEDTSTRRSTPLVEELAQISKAGKAQSDSLSLPSELEVSLACTSLLTRSPLFQSYDNMLSRILRSMSEKQPTFRTKALRTLGQIIVADPDILSLTNVQQQVALRISDPSPGVREASIELVSKHIASDPVLGKKYYEVIKGRINDAGLGVRKRVIKLLKDIYFKCDDKVMQSEITSSILPRITDEEHSMRELAMKTMEELWFVAPGEELDIGGVFDFVRLNMKAQKMVRSRTMAMVRVLGENDERKISLFKRLLRTMSSVSGKTEKMLQTKLDACRLSVHCLYDIALNDASDGNMANFKRCLLAISLFARSTPSVFSAEQMTCLEPYLKGSTDKDEQEIAYLVVAIFRTLLALTQLIFPTEFLSRTMTTIATGMTSVSLKHLKESVPAVCHIAETLNDYSNIIKVVGTCFRPVTASQKQIESRSLNAGSTTLIRCLYLLGLFAQHAKIDQHAQQFNAALGVAPNVSMTGLIAKSLAAFASPIVPEALRKIAITSYGFLCLGNTEYFKSETAGAQQIIISSLRGESITLKRTILEIFQEYFAIEEHKAELLEGKEREDIDLSSDIGVLTGTAKTANNDEITFFLAGNYLEDIMACAMSDAVPLAITGTEVLDSMVRGGLAAPNDWFATLVALETSPIARVRQIAGRARAYAVNRYEQATDGAIQAIQKMFDYRKTVVKSTDGYQLIQGEPSALINPLYGDIKAKKRFRLRHLRNLVNLLDRDSQTKENIPPVQVDFARFIIENLLYLDYGTIEEVFTVIHSIDRIMATTGVSLRQVIDSGESSEPIGVVAQRATVFALMLELKQYLKASYNLSEAKCRAFDPKKSGNAKDNKAAVRTRSLGVIDWSTIPYINEKPQTVEQLHDQMRAFLILAQREDIAGAQEVNSTSEDDMQNVSVKDDDAVTVVTNGEDEFAISQEGGVSTPQRKVKKRKEGSENGSAKKRAKVIPFQQFAG